MREVRKLDVFEISVVMAPMNNGTRVLSTKATGDDLPSHTELERRLIEEGIIAPVISSTAQPHAGDLDVAAAERDLMLSVLNARRNGDEERKAARPWIADPDDYTDSQWRAACVLDLAEGVTGLDGPEHACPCCRGAAPNRQDRTPGGP